MQFQKTVIAYRLHNYTVFENNHYKQINVTDYIFHTQTKTIFDWWIIQSHPDHTMSTFSKKTFILIILFATFLFLFYTHKLFQQHHDISTPTPPIHQRSLEQIFEPTWKSLKTHPLPKWFQDAKLGIFIHWGLYSVPGTCVVVRKSLIVV